MQIPSISLLAHGLSNRAQVTVLPLRNPGGGSDVDRGSLRVIDQGGAGIRFRTLLYRTIETISSIHRSSPFDVLHAYWLYEPGLVAGIAGRLLNVPVVASIGGAELAAMPEIGYGGYRTRRGRLLNRTVMGASSIVAGGSGYVLDLARQASPRMSPKLRLAPLPVRVAINHIASPNPYRKRDAINLLQVGAYIPVKGQDLSVQALTRLISGGHNLRLTMIGEDPYGYRRRLQALSADLGFSGRITMLDRMPHDALAGYYSHADLLLMPSRHESQGMTVLEAAAHGLPTVGADVGVVRDLAPEAAVATPVNDARALANAIQDTLGSEEVRGTLSAAAHRAVRDQYSEEPVLERWLSIYDEAIHVR